MFHQQQSGSPRDPRNAIRVVMVILCITILLSLTVVGIHLAYLTGNPAFLGVSIVPILIAMIKFIMSWLFSNK